MEIKGKIITAYPMQEGKNSQTGSLLLQRRGMVGQGVVYNPVFGNTNNKFESQIKTTINQAIENYEEHIK